MLRQNMWILMVLITSIASGEMLAQTTNDDQSKITERDFVEQSPRRLPGCSPRATPMRSTGIRFCTGAFRAVR